MEKKSLPAGSENINKDKMRRSTDQILSNSGALKNIVEQVRANPDKFLPGVPSDTKKVEISETRE